jgi:hypothetical protein
MSRFIAFAVFAALVVGCSDATVAPRSLSPTSTSFDGTPPPPPVTGDGFGDFFATSSFDDLSAASAPISGFCGSVGGAITYRFSYSTDQATDPLGANQIAIIKFDEDFTHQITIHKSPSQPLEAAGIIAGVDGTFGRFSFRITQVTFGTLSPAHFHIDVNGVLTTDLGSCDAVGQFDGSLVSAPD